MVIVNPRFPHLIMAKDAAGVWQEIGRCRDQPNNSGEKLQLADSTYYEFKSIIFAPAGTERLLLNQDVRVIGERGETRLEEAVKRVSVDSFQVRIWI